MAMRKREVGAIRTCLEMSDIGLKAISESVVCWPDKCNRLLIICVKCKYIVYLAPVQGRRTWIAIYVDSDYDRQVRQDFGILARLSVKW